MIKCAIVGASGYVGAELVTLLAEHSHFEMTQLWVSENSVDAGKPISKLYPRLQGICDKQLTGLVGDKASLMQLAEDNDALFLCTEHDIAHKIVHQLFPHLDELSLKIYDLSGAHRLNQSELYASVYGFEHQHQAALDASVYGLAEWHEADIRKSPLIAVPGCYPTAISLALKPLVTNALLDTQQKPIINAVSGISGAGRKATKVNSFCELSLQAYKVFSHRHQPEIEQELGCPVVFTPHIADYDRGILATIYCRLQASASAEQLNQVYEQAYGQSEKVHCVDYQPAINHVKHRDHCLIHWEYQADSQELIITSAIDNLLKGAASQALQCAELGCL